MKNYDLALARLFGEFNDGLTRLVEDMAAEAPDDVDQALADISKQVIEILTQKERPAAVHFNDHCAPIPPEDGNE